MAARLDFWPTGVPQVPETGGFEVLRQLAAKVGCSEGSVSCGEEGIPPEDVKDCIWQHIFSDPTHWWDKRWRKPTPRLPDFTDRKSKVGLAPPLWLNNLHKPVWVKSQLAPGLKRSPESVCSSAQGQSTYETLAAADDHLEVGMCRKLCEDGRITDSVEALHLLVHRGCHVDNNLFYRVLKTCIAVKDLVLGRRIHALAIKSGYEGDPFLATHLMGLYASHRRLDEAMRVFTKVAVPTAYNWATIIFAHARHGEAAEAIRLYRQMRESTSVSPTEHIYVAVLKACAAAGDAVAGKQVHAQILGSSRKRNVFIETGLVNMYVNCGSLEDAHKVFDSLPDKDVVTWNAMIAGYTQRGLGHEALCLYNTMQQEGVTLPDSVTFLCLLQACSSVGVGALLQGRKLHAQMKERGVQDDVILGGSLVNMYAKCGSLEDARRIFEKLPDRNVVTWNAMLAGYAHQGLGQEVLSLFSSMQQEGITLPDSVTFVCLLQACASVGVGALPLGKQLHAEIEERGLQDDAVLGGSLFNMYTKCGSLKDARRIFDTLGDKGVVRWTAMIASYAQGGMGQEALSLYRSMQQEGLTVADSVTFVCLLQACASVGVGALQEGLQLHVQIEERGLQDDVMLGGSLVNMYAKCGSLDDARSTFDRLPYRNVVTWTAMIAGYAEQGMGQEALSLYSSMKQEGMAIPNHVTFVCLLQACASVGVGALPLGKQLHEAIEEQGLQDDVVLGGSMVNMYAKCGSLEEARRVFDSLPDRNVVTWNAMFSGYAQQGMGEEALSLYNSMQQEGHMIPDSVTFVALLQACASVGSVALQQGKQLHSQVEGRGLLDDVVVGGSLVNMYAKCESLEDARSVFERLPDRNVVTWNAMLAGYVQQGMGEEALSLYRFMQQEVLAAPDSVTFVCLLQACAIVAALPLGKELHVQIQDQGLQADLVVGAALVSMYAKCGSMFDSQEVFDSLPERTIEAWSALIAGYSRQGDSEVVFDLLDRMRLVGTQPNAITVLSVLTVCSYVGLVDKGRKYFEAMRTEFGICPTIELYTCMIGLLGRAGHLDEALQMAKTMPLLPSAVVWLTLLGACQKWNNVEIGQQAFEFAVSVDEKDAAPYVLMSNIYASAQMWEEAKEMQARRVRSEAWKKPGQSWWTDVGGVLHTFVVGKGQRKHLEDVKGMLCVHGLNQNKEIPHL